MKVNFNILNEVERKIGFSMLKYKMCGRWYCVRNQFLLHNRGPTSISSCMPTHTTTQRLRRGLSPCSKIRRTRDS